MKRSRVNPMSARRRKEIKRYRELRIPFLQRNPICQCIKPDGLRCRKSSQQVHHRKGRHDCYLAVITWMAVCPECHDLIEQHRDWAKERGYLINRASTGPIPPLNQQQ